MMVRKRLSHAGETAPLCGQTWQHTQPDVTFIHFLFRVTSQQPGSDLQRCKQTDRHLIIDFFTSLCHLHTLVRHIAVQVCCHRNNNTV